jgi:drug/metabolite transporter (DMT)-like permease
MHFAILTALLFALTGVCAAQASRILGAGRANAWRLVIALALLAGWVHGFGPGLRGSGLPWFLCAGGIGFGFGGWCTFQALRRVGSTLTLLIGECAAALFAVVIGWVVLGASLHPWQMVFCAMVIGGVVVGMTPGPIPALKRDAVRAGCGFATLGALFQAVSLNLSSHAFVLMKGAGERIQPIEAAYQRLLGGAAIAIVIHCITVALRGKSDVPVPDTHAAPFPKSRLPAPVWVTLNALFGPVLGVTCLLWAVSLIRNPGLVQTVAATATLLTVPLARWLEGARPGPGYFIGCGLALGGVAGLWLA